MIYGQDQPVMFPTMDLYDQGAMSMYINALRDQYQLGLKDQEDFYTKFGDFTSPIAKDVEGWDERVINPVINLIDAMYAQGIDPVRNLEARQMIARQIAKTPRGWANKAKQRANAAEEYVKNRAALLRAGKWSSDFEKFRLGGKTLETWDPDYDGEWTETSPAEYQTLQEFIHPSFANLKPRALDLADVESRGYLYNPLYDYTGITEGDMRRSLEQYLPGVAGNPVYDYYYDRARRAVLAETGNLNPSENEVYQRFVNDAIKADSLMMEPFDYTPNKFALADYEHKQRMQEKAYAASLRGQNNGAGDWPTDNTKIPQLSTDIAYQSMSLFEDNDNNIVDDITNIINYYNSLPAEFKESSGGIPTSQGAPGQVVRNTKKKELTHKSKQNKQYVDYFTSVLNEGNFEQLLNFDLNGNPIGYKKEVQEILKKTRDLSNASDVQKREASEMFYNKRIIDMGGSDNDILLSTAFGSNKVKNDYFNEAYVPIALKQSGLQYAPVRKLNSTSNTRYSLDAIETKFNDWLRSGTAGDGYLVNRNVGSAYIPGQNKIDLSINGDISNAQFESFLRSIGKKTDKSTKTEIARQLGLGLVTKEGDVLSKDNNQKAEYYRIPLIKTLDKAAVRRANVLRNKVNYGATASLNLTRDAYAAAYQIEDDEEE